MRSKMWTLAGLFALLGVLAIPCAQPAAAQDANDTFVITVPVNINNFTYTPVTLPAGMRLVVDYVSISGDAESSQGAVQPIVILNAALTGGSANLFFIAPTQSNLVSTQFYHNEQTVIYADTLSVGPAFAGYTPSFMSFNVVISGHLVKIPKADTAAADGAS